MSILRIEVKVDGKLVEIHEFDTVVNDFTVAGRFRIFINEFSKEIRNWSYTYFFPEHE